jgi:hypothetical protein
MRRDIGDESTSQHKFIYVDINVYEFAKNYKSFGPKGQGFVEDS